ncbi:hypothetical protein ACQKEX_14800 [Bacillus pumilus]|uniref:hypothetical protein n=1 Tax=Bacillus TaxID=1386 RepID=UPI00096538B1|nr:hypothetical protein [Bacillus pumilus]MBU8576399.1 hypothetical protein [Bacillus pumilus]OLP64402.1 hypothetical protein BACPU_26270 [Bacillus pumilus]
MAKEKVNSSKKRKHAVFNLRTSSLSEEVYKHVEAEMEGKTFISYVLPLIERDMQARKGLVDPEIRRELDEMRSELSSLRELTKDILSVLKSGQVDINLVDAENEPVNKKEVIKDFSDIEIRGSIEENYDIDF